MSDSVSIPQNVYSFLHHSANHVGNIKADTFGQRVATYIFDNDIGSPIEQALYIALRSVQEMNLIEDAEPHNIGDDIFILGLFIGPQFIVGKYRVDFAVSYNWVEKRHEQGEKVVLVECDSQEWHERSETERRYEKARDRYLAMQGYKVFHYTGKEIQDEPMRVAAEIISFVMNTPMEDVIIAGDYETAAKYVKHD